MNRRSAAPVLLAAVAVTLVLSPGPARGQTEVMLVTNRPPAPGTVLQDELSMSLQIFEGSAPGTVKYLDRMEVRPDGSVRLVRLADSSHSDTGTRRALEGVPLLWRAAPEGWTAALERGAPSEAQAKELKALVPPFVTDALYPARPVRFGERWNLSADGVRALLSRLAEQTVSTESVDAKGLSGWVELGSLAERDGLRCALLRFAVTTLRADKSETRVSGEAVRSLTNFQDLNLEAKMEEAEPGKPVHPLGSFSIRRTVSQPPDPRDADALFKLGERSYLGQGVPKDYAQARAWYQKAAEAGSASAMNRLGHMFGLGLGVPKDEAQAFAWYRKAADAGNAEAMNAVGLAYEAGQGVAQDYAQARAWYQKAAEAGNPTAMNNLGGLYYQGQGVARDYAQARQWYEKAAAAGSAEAMYSLGWLYEHGQGVARDDAQAVTWYQKAADAGHHAGAMDELGSMYEEGRGVAKDYAQARQWYEKAAAAGNAQAMYNLAVLYGNGDGVPKDGARALYWYRKAADAGDADAMVALGVRYDQGRGVAQDYAQAFAWYRKAADAGVDDVMGRLGDLYEHGLGVTRDYALALDWHRKGADAGHADAMNCVGFAYWAGQGVARDYAQARAWYEKAAAAGNADAMRHLGVVYGNGDGVPKDDAQAVTWYQKAAAAGNARAMANLGDLYKAGQGVPQDYGQAREWYQKAAAAGDAYAMYAVGELYYQGQGVAQDYAQADQWYEKAAAAGSASAMYSLGWLYEHGQGVARDEAQALAWYRKGADAGSAGAMFKLAGMYADGRGVAQDYDQARQWYQKAAEAGHAAAMFKLGVLYEDGRGAARDDAQALAWYRKGADAGDADAMGELGARYEEGRGVAQDYAQAFTWFGKAAAAGNADAMFRLGFLYEEGEGVARDYAQALAWFRKAADTGDAFAMAALGGMYEEGEGVARDYPQALGWYRKAADAGNDQAKQALARLQSSANDHQVANHATGSVAANQNPTPAFRDADDWANRYRNAPSITEAEFLQQVTEVDLEVATAGLKGLVTEEELKAGLQAALQTEGFQINAQAPVALYVTLAFGRDTINNYFRGETYHNPVMIEFMSMRFLVAARVYREGSFQQLAVSPAGNFLMTARSGRVGKQDVLKDLPDDIHTVLGVCRTHIARPTPEEDASWRASLWNARENDRMYQQYMACQNARGIDAERVFRGLNRFRLETDLIRDASDCITRSQLESSWSSALRGAHFPLDPGSPFQILHQILSVRTDAGITIFGIEAVPYYSNTDVIEVREDNVVFPLAVTEPGQARKEEKLVRATVQIDEHDNFNILLPEERVDGLSRQIDKSITDVIERLRFRR